MPRYRVKLGYGPYTHVEAVVASEDADSEEVIAMAWARLRRRGLLTLPMAATSAKILEEGES
jgi:hypothetical protein